MKLITHKNTPLKGCPISAHSYQTSATTQHLSLLGTSLSAVPSWETCPVQLATSPTLCCPLPSHGILPTLLKNGTLHFLKPHVVLLNCSICHHWNSTCISQNAFVFCKPQNDLYLFCIPIKTDVQVFRDNCLLWYLSSVDQCLPQHHINICAQI